MSDIADLPVIDIGSWKSRPASIGEDNLSSDIIRDCSRIAESLHEFGVVLVKDPDIDEEHNEDFIDMMEQYYEQSDGITDARPELSYQIGVTPGGIERPRNHCERIAKIPEQDRPIVLCPPEADPKWRFFWRIGDRPEETDFPEQNSNLVVPDPSIFPDWTEKMNLWGNAILHTIETVSEMLAVGLNIPEDSFRSRMAMGSHLLAPTGTDLSKFGNTGTVLAGFHYDLCFLTIHGKSRFPGLQIWLKSGKKYDVSVPKGCLLIQSGMQLEHLTGGYIQAGFHEVSVTDKTAKVIEYKKLNNESLWRVSSTLFSHIATDQILEPLGVFAQGPLANCYLPIRSGDLVRAELEAIALGKGHTLADLEM